MEHKVISFFWGNNTLSWLRYMTLYSFKKYNKDWEINLYLSEQDIVEKVWKGKEQQDFFSYTGDNYINKINELDINIKHYNTKDKNGMSLTPSQKSNFFKWNLMATSGGVYADMDILFVRSIDDIYLKSKEYDAGITYYKNYFSIGFLFSNGNNKLFKKIYDSCMLNFDKNNYQGAGVKILYSMNLNWKTIEENYGKIYNMINADLNGAYQIIRKVFPEAFAEGIEGVGLHPVRVNII